MLCYKSHLLHDYNINKDNDLKFKELKLTESELTSEVIENDFVILCVQSSQFNNNNNMS